MLMERAGSSSKLSSYVLNGWRIGHPVTAPINVISENPLNFINISTADEDLLLMTIQ